MPKHIQSQKNIKAIPSLYIIKWKWHNVTLNSVVYFRCCHIS